MRGSIRLIVAAMVLMCLAAVALPGAAGQGAAAAPGRGAPFQEFDRVYREAVARYGVVGSGFAMVQRGRLAHQSFVGVGDLDTGRPVDERTIFHWASITKTFTGIAIMQLRDRGRLKLDDPIVKYIPELRQVHDPFGDVGEVTIEQLMSHRAGFRSPTWPWGGDKDWQPFEPRTWQQLAAMLPYTEIEFRPGSKYSYSNPGVVFLGRVIEMLSGDDFEVYIDKNILKPLEMHDTYFDTTPYHLLPYRSHSYRKTGTTVTPGRFDADTGITVSNGGLNSPIRDMAKYVAFLIGAPDSPARQAVFDGVLKRSSLEEMWQPRAEVPVEGKNGRGRHDSIGLSFFVEDNYGTRFVGHHGDQNGFIAHLYVNPSLRAGYVVNFNTWVNEAPGAPGTTERLDLEIKTYLFEKVFPALRQ